MSSSKSQIIKDARSALGIFTKSQAANGKSVAFERLHAYVLQDRASELLPSHRVTNCLKRRIDKDKKRAVVYNEIREKAHWSNVQRCGAIWVCPVCAKQITEVRRAELAKAVKIWRQQIGHDVKLLTLTFSHSKSHSLKSLLECQKLALKYFYEHRLFKNISEKLRIVGKIKSLEVTYGANGWHPHNHILLFSQDADDLAYEYKDRLAALWIQCCKKAGLAAPNKRYGLDIRDGSFADQYVSKWGIDYEMTKGHVKKGTKDSLTPFDLLQLSIDNQPVFDKLPSKLFQEFVIAMKGARQLVWSRGLKLFFQIEDKTDEEAANEVENDAIFLGEVEGIIFKLLIKHKKRHEYLKWCENDMKNGCWGCGEVEFYTRQLIQLEIDQLEKHEVDFMQYRGLF